jgi:pyruvate/2-oxoglutarate dehydrogenase complex dihydrolipoamide dehydrogenase (E3) component
VSPSHIAVVGAGVAGLAAAAELAGRTNVTVLDRLPVAGGVLAYDLPMVRELTARCRSAGVQWLLGTTAVRWDDGRLLTVGPSGIRWLDAAHLVFAGGCRPATSAELPLAGPRLAGVLPAPVAIHLAEAKVTVGRRVIIIGTGNWARAAGDAIAHQCSRVTVIAAEDGQHVSFPHDALISGWAPVAVAGSGRVSALTLQRAGQRHVLDCDAVILASSPRPLRNVDGAIGESAHAVTFVQPVADEGSWELVAAAGRTTADAVHVKF